MNSINKILVFTLIGSFSLLYSEIEENDSPIMLKVSQKKLEKFREFIKEGYENLCDGEDMPECHEFRKFIKRIDKLSEEESIDAKDFFKPFINGLILLLTHTKEEIKKEKTEYRIVVVAAAENKDDDDNTNDNKELNNNEITKE